LVTVDLMPRHTRLLRALFPHRIQFHAIRGSSYAPETVGRVRRRLGDRKIDLLFIDGDHRYAGVAADLAQYAPLVAPEGLIAVHDIVPTRQAGDPIKTQRWVGGVPQFWQELRSNASEHWEFVADHNQEGFGIGVVCKRGLRPCGAIS
jgi:predicted O-methyltransferase YrrM